MDSDRVDTPVCFRLVTRIHQDVIGTSRPVVARIIDGAAIAIPKSWSRP
jgi:hypothetical protein